MSLMKIAVFGLPMHRVSCIQPICISHLLDHDHHQGLRGAGLYCCATCTYLYINIYIYIYIILYLLCLLFTSMLKFPWVEGKLKQTHGCVPHRRQPAKAFLWEINGTDFLGTVWKIRETRPLYDGWFKQSGCSLSSADIGQRQLQRLSLSSETETRCDSS